MRVLIVSPGHPDHGGGGTERAAYSLFQRLRQDPEVGAAAFVARAEPSAIGHDGHLGSYRLRTDELLASPPPVDSFSMQTTHLDGLAELVESLVTGFRPDVVHLHHVLFWGVEVLKLFADAGVKVVLTLHDFTPICAHYGQMVKSSGGLCYAAYDAECAACIPMATAGHIFLRRAIVKEMMGYVDAFLAPSAFLARRFEEWGLPAGRPVAVIDNLLNPSLAGAVGGLDRRRTDDDGQIVLGFFGQITPFKGVDVLLAAMPRLVDGPRHRLKLKVHGENLHYRTQRFGRRLAKLFRTVPNVVQCGNYDNSAVIPLMRDCDYIVVPSIWWENSPLVIQEARLAGRPIIASNIGGMAEKTDASVDMLVPPGDQKALAEVLSGIADGTIRPNLKRARTLARRRLDAEGRLYEQHLLLFRSLLSLGPNGRRGQGT